MRKIVLTLLSVILAASLLTACFSIGMAEETGTKETKKQEEVKKQKKKTKKNKPDSKRGDAGEDKGKSSEKSSEDSGVEASVNRAGKKVMDAAHSGAEAVKNGLNEGYDKLKNEK